MEDLPQEFSLFRETITFIRTNLANNIKVEDLSQRMKLSENQFRRKFKEEFGVTPQQFILRARLQATGNLLRNGTKPIAIIAAECGFSDQSYFTKQFKPFFGETPLQYRRRWSNSWNTHGGIVINYLTFFLSSKKRWWFYGAVHDEQSPMFYREFQRINDLSKLAWNMSLTRHIKVLITI